MQSFLYALQDRRRQNQEPQPAGGPIIVVIASAATVAAIKAVTGIAAGATAAIGVGGTAAAPAATIVFTTASTPAVVAGGVVGGAGGTSILAGIWHAFVALGAVKATVLSGGAVLLFGGAWYERGRICGWVRRAWARICQRNIRAILGNEVARALSAHVEEALNALQPRVDEVVQGDEPEQVQAHAYVIMQELDEKERLLATIPIEVAGVVERVRELRARINGMRQAMRGRMVELFGQEGVVAAV